MRAVEQWHGTASGYTNHRCRCADCRNAWNTYRRIQAKRQRSTAVALTGVAPPEFPRKLCGPETRHIHYPDTPRGRNNGAIYRLATAICTWCDHQKACADWAIAHREPYGVWGGTTPRQRRNLGHITPDSHAQSDHTTQHEDTA